MRASLQTWSGSCSQVSCRCGSGEGKDVVVRWLSCIPSRSCKLLPGTAAFLVLLTTVALSQQTRALRGRVTDEDGHVVAGAVVQLQNSSTIWIRSYITQRDGLYYFDELLTNVSYQVQANYHGGYSHIRSLSKFNSRTVATVNLTINSSSSKFRKQ